MEDQKKELMSKTKRFEEECGLKVDITSNKTFIISLGGLQKNEEEFCICEITVDTSTIAKGEYKSKYFRYRDKDKK